MESIELFQVDFESRNTDLQCALSRVESELTDEKAKLRKLKGTLNTSTHVQATTEKLQQQLDRLQVNNKIILDQNVEFITTVYRSIKLIRRPIVDPW